MLRLVVFSPYGVRRLPIASGPLRVGGDASCDLVLEDETASSHEVVLEREATGDRVHLRVPDGLPAVQVNGQACRTARLDTLDEIRIGGVTLLIEDSNATTQKMLLEELRSRSGLSSATGPEVTEAQNGATGADSPVGSAAQHAQTSMAGRFVEHLSRLSEWVANDSGSEVSVESIVVRVLRDFGGGACFLFEGPLDASCGVKFAAASEASLVGRAEPVLQLMRDHVRPDVVHSFGEEQCVLDGVPVRLFYRRLSALDREYCVVVMLAGEGLDPQGWSPVLGFASLADLLVLGLVHHVGRYEPILPGRETANSLSLAPGLILGPSQASTTLGEAIRSAARGVHVVLQGELGSGHELVARSLHMSSPRRAEPFVIVECGEPNLKRLQSDLFGAEIEGRSGPVRREGKLRSAAGGTVLLRGIEGLPLEVQGQLVRILRSGELHGPAPQDLDPFSARLIASTSVDLEDLCEQANFRRDLLVRLSQFMIHVPSLNERRDDLPLLLQTLVNRFSHETGKRVRGITVRALSLLTAYRFPGNLRELENVVRHMVYLAEPETPMDVGCLPVQIRNPAPAHRADPSEISGNELKLTAVVGRVERTAIREALRRSQGNKSRAARLLGLSRNGLAQKMARHGLGSGE